MTCFRNKCPRIGDDKCGGIRASARADAGPHRHAETRASNVKGFELDYYYECGLERHEGWAVEGVLLRGESVQYVRS